MKHPNELSLPRKAADEGRDAYLARQPRNSCPYALPHLRAAWILGFDRARNRHLHDLIGGSK